MVCAINYKALYSSLLHLLYLLAVVLLEALIRILLNVFFLIAAEFDLVLFGFSFFDL